MTWWRVCTALGLAAVLSSAASPAAQPPQPPQGTQAAARRSVWEGAYTKAQADRGKTAYDADCAFCHGSDLSGQSFAPPLVGEPFTGRWQEGTLGDLFTIVKETMPQDKPATLGDVTYAAIVAYLLESNRYPAGPDEMKPDPAALATVGFARTPTGR